MRGLEFVSAQERSLQEAVPPRFGDRRPLPLSVTTHGMSMTVCRSYY